MGHSNTVLVATHRRSGTHWTIDALRNNSPDVNQLFFTLEDINPRKGKRPVSSFQNAINEQEKTTLIKTHLLPEEPTWDDNNANQYVLSIINQSPIIYVYRDGRDVMVSFYYYIKSFNEKYNGVSFTDFLRTEVSLSDGSSISRPAYWANHFRQWSQMQNICLVKYEELESDYNKVVIQMGNYLNIQIAQSIQPINVPSTNLLYKIKTRTLSKLGFNPKSSAVFPRKGKSGDWQSHFSDDDLEYFENETQGLISELKSNSI